MPHDDPCCSAILHRENLLDLPPIGGEQDVTAFARNNSLTSQQLRYCSQSSTSSQGGIVDPEASVGFSNDLAQIVTSNTTDKDDNKMESFNPQQRRETGGNAKMLIQSGSVNMRDFLRIPRKSQGKTLDNSKSDDSRRWECEYAWFFFRIPRNPPSNFDSFVVFLRFSDRPSHTCVLCARLWSRCSSFSLLLLFVFQYIYLK